MSHAIINMPAGVLEGMIVFQSVPYAIASTSLIIVKHMCMHVNMISLTSPFNYYVYSPLLMLLEALSKVILCNVLLQYRPWELWCVPNNKHGVYTYIS